MKYPKIQVISVVLVFTSFSEMGIKPMTFKELVGIVGAPTILCSETKKVSTLVD